MADDFQEKTEEATPKKLADARKKGRVARSQDFTSSFILIAGILVLFVSGPYLHWRLYHLAAAIFTHLSEPFVSVEALSHWMRQGVYYVVLTILPLLVGVVVVAIGANVYQVGFVIATEGMELKWKQINLFDASNYKRFFNAQALARLAFGLGKLAVVASICYLMVKSVMTDISHLMYAEPKETYQFIFWHAFSIALVIALILAALGLMDLFFQKWKFGEDMKMSKQEVKDERKQTEGDPQLKSKMRSLMQAFSQTRMKDHVPRSDVVVANPIHYAVALKYDADTMAAPVCVAKGARRMALAIKEIANAHDIPIVENPPLAQTLYKSVEVGATVPSELYHSVAEVLAYVYRLEEQLTKQAKGRTSLAPSGA